MRCDGVDDHLRGLAGEPIGDGQARLRRRQRRDDAVDIRYGGGRRDDLELAAAASDLGDDFAAHGDREERRIRPDASAVHHRDLDIGLLAGVHVPDPDDVEAVNQACGVDAVAEHRAVGVPGGDREAELARAFGDLELELPPGGDLHLHRAHHHRGHDADGRGGGADAAVVAEDDGVGDALALSGEVRAARSVQDAAALIVGEGEEVIGGAAVTDEGQQVQR